MDVMMRRRELMTLGSKPDTSPKIAEYGKHWNRTFGGTTDNANWCITDWYQVVSAPKGYLSINGYVGNDTNQITFQYYFTDNGHNFHYFAGTNPRTIAIGTSTRLDRISFSIEQSAIDNSYAYIVQTGQILFSGKNTSYYGYTNINDMPSA